MLFHIYRILDLTVDQIHEEFYEYVNKYDVLDQNRSHSQFKLYVETLIKK